MLAALLTTLFAAAPVAAQSWPTRPGIEKDGSGAITIDGEAAELKAVEPFTGTPALSDLRDHNDERPEPPREGFDVAEVEPPANVSRLDSFRNRRDSDDEGPAGAA